MIPSWMPHPRKRPWPAAEIMAQALYHPQEGYYRRREGPWGFASKDYYTALDVGPLLGEALALRLEAEWLAQDRPARFQVLEPGAGRGWLGRDLLTAARGAFQEALEYVHCDDNPAARTAAEAALEPWLAKGRARFVAERDPLESFSGAVVSNEWLDALPAQHYRWDGTQWLWLGLSEQGPCWMPVAQPDDATRWFESTSDGLEPEDGSVWADGLAPALATSGAALKCGLFLAIDYGDTAARLLAKGASLRRYRGHRVDDRWWEELGACDLTADVDWTRVASQLAASGLTPAPLQSLGSWIRAHAPLATWEAEWMALEPPVRLKRMENLLQLTLPNLMGERFKVLEARKG